MAQTRLKQLREDAVLTVHELAKTSGVSDDTISKIENGQRVARPSTLRKLASALGVSPQELRRPAKVEEPEEATTRPKVLGQPPLDPPAAEELLRRAGVSSRWATMPDDEWNERFDKADLDGALALCRAVAAERLATQEIRWALGRSERSAEEGRVVARMLATYMTREFQFYIKSRDSEAFLDSGKELQRELVGALG